MESSHKRGKDDEAVIEGVLQCTNPLCQCEYPIIDGIPFLLPNIRSFIAANAGYILSRNDLSSTVRSLLGDCCSVDSEFNLNRHYLSSYGWCHYGDLNPENADPEAGSTFHASQILESHFNELRSTHKFESKTEGVIIDLGCSVGRNSFELAKSSNQMTLGVDVNVAMLRMARSILDEGNVKYPLRRGGVVYTDVQFDAEFENSEQVDFWACDATCLPFESDSFERCHCLNTLDSVSSPYELIQSVSRILSVNGVATIACPYDWSSSVTGIEAWIGGHSQRANHEGKSDEVMRRLFSPPYEIFPSLRLVSEKDDIPWVVRLHDRSKNALLPARISHIKSR